MALEKILLAVDGSKESEKAAMLVLDLAQNATLDVVIIHVCSEMPMALTDADGIEDVLKHFGEGVAVEAGKIAGFYKEIMSRMRIKNRVRLTPGDAAEEIVKCANAEQRDLIVMGATGHTGLAGMIMGSVTLKVIKDSNLPILLAR